MNTRSSKKVEDFTNSECMDMLECLAKASQDFSKARTLYRKKFIDDMSASKRRQLPTEEDFRKIVYNLNETGSFRGTPQEDGEEDEETDMEDDEEWEGVEEEEHLDDDEGGPYNYTYKPVLLAENYPPRLKFCKWYVDQVKASPGFAPSILWTDEAIFTRYSVCNVLSQQVWEPKDASTYSEAQDWRIIVWAAIIDEVVIGPIFLPEKINVENYLTFLKNDLEAELAKLPNASSKSLLFQHNGSSRHFTKKVRTYLSSRFEQWIGQGGTVEWPESSTDLSPVDFFLWTYLNYEIYGDPTQRCKTRKEMEERIRTAFKDIPPYILKGLPGKILKRAQLCVKEEGGPFESLLF